MSSEWKVRIMHYFKGFCLKRLSREVCVLRSREKRKKASRQQLKTDEVNSGANVKKKRRIEGMWT